MVLASKVGQYQVFSLQDGSSREGLNFAQLGSFVIPLPEIEEQKAIVRAAKKETDKIDEVVCREKKEIDLLQELRTSLISEVVTGKIDVRDEVPQRAEVAA
jgi:type I restriction enzyme S subunit